MRFYVVLWTTRRELETTVALHIGPLVSPVLRASESREKTICNLMFTHILVHRSKYTYTHLLPGQYTYIHLLTGCIYEIYNLWSKSKCMGYEYHYGLYVYKWYFGLCKLYVAYMCIYVAYTQHISRIGSINFYKNGKKIFFNNIIHVLFYLRSFTLWSGLQ